MDIFEWRSQEKMAGKIIIGKFFYYNWIYIISPVPQNIYDVTNAITYIAISFFIAIIKIKSVRNVKRVAVRTRMNSWEFNES